MKALLLCMVAVPAVGLAQDEAISGDLPTSPLNGQWIVDLRPTLDSQPYTQPMELRIAGGGAVSGKFYGTEIEGGMAGKGQGRHCVAFRTRDGSGPYQHAACLVDEKLVGQSWSEGRQFVLPWTATRTETKD